MAVPAIPMFTQAELQQVSPNGQLLWDWKSQDHISLAETGRWWPRAIELIFFF